MDRLTIEYMEFHVPKEMCTINIHGEADDCLGCIEICGEKHGDCAECCIQKAFSKLGEYEKAEEQGLLLKLPCKVGDYVYQLDRTNKKIMTQKVQDITLYMGRKSFSMQIVFETTGMCFQREFGRTVFLNKKEAMQALKEISSRGST